MRIILVSAKKNAHAKNFKRPYCPFSSIQQTLSLNLGLKQQARELYDSWHSEFGGGQEVTAVQVTDVLQKAGLLKNSAVRSVHRLFESKTAEDSEGSSSESSGTDQRRTDKLEDEWPQSAQGVELDAPVPTLASQPVEPETRRPTRDELPFFSHNNAVHMMRIKDIDGLAKETFSDSGHEKLDQIYASICNPKVKMLPFLDDADMTTDALEQGDRLVAGNHPSSLSVQKGLDRLCVVPFTLHDGCRFKELVMQHGVPVAARGVDAGLVRSADKDQCLARCQKDKKHDQSTGSKPLAAQPSSAHLQIFAAKQPPLLHEQQAIRSKVVELAGTMLTAEGKAKVDQILANLYNPGQENVEPLLSDNDVHPLGLLMDAAALSKAPLVLAGLQELNRVPTILSDGRFKTLVMANSLTPAVMAQGTPQPGHQTGSSTGVVPAAPGKTRTEDQQGTLQSMESGHPDQESRKLSESHAAQVQFMPYGVYNNAVLQH
ncbi:TPA: hypothetical protein ACH3X1_010175 [Trebouxia sp. C0004]